MRELIQKLKKISTISAMIVAAVILVLTVAALLNPTPSEEDDVPKPNLDTFKIEELTEEQIIKLSACFNASRFGRHFCGKESGIDTKKSKYREVDRNHCRYSAKKAVGIIPLNAACAENTALTFNISSSLGGGAGKIIIIKDDEIIEIFDCGENKCFTYQVEDKSTFYVKGIFENATGINIELLYSFPVAIRK